MEERTILIEKLKKFIEAHPVAMKAAGHLKKGASADIVIQGVDGIWHFIKTEAGGKFIEGPSPSADFSMQIPPRAIEELSAMQGDNMAEFGILFFKYAGAQDFDNKIFVQLKSGLLTLTAKGYVKLVLAGGPSLAAWIATKGFGGPAGIKKAFDRLREKRE